MLAGDKRFSLFRPSVNDEEEKVFLNLFLEVSQKFLKFYFRQKFSIKLIFFSQPIFFHSFHSEFNQPRLGQGILKGGVSLYR
jgi:hypothetical protein